MITPLEPDILECEVRWALESITMNNASGGQGRRPRAPDCNGTGVAVRSYPTSNEQWLCGRRRAKRSHSTFKILHVRRYSLSKVRSSGCALLEQPEEIPHAQGKRNPSKTIGVARGHQRADILKP